MRGEEEDMKFVNWDYNKNLLFIIQGLNVQIWNTGMPIFALQILKVNF